MVNVSKYTKHGYYGYTFMQLLSPSQSWWSHDNPRNPWPSFILLDPRVVHPQGTQDSPILCWSKVTGTNMAFCPVCPRISPLPCFWIFTFWPTCFGCKTTIQPTKPFQEKPIESVLRFFSNFFDSVVFESKIWNHRLLRKIKHEHVYLAGVWTNPFEKYAQVKLDHETPNIRGENSKTYLSCHHLDMYIYTYFWQRGTTDGFLVWTCLDHEPSALVHWSPKTRGSEQRQSLLASVTWRFSVWDADGQAVTDMFFSSESKLWRRHF